MVLQGALSDSGENKVASGSRDKRRRLCETVARPCQNTIKLDRPRRNVGAGSGREEKKGEEETKSRSQTFRAHIIWRHRGHCGVR